MVLLSRKVRLIAEIAGFCAISASTELTGYVKDVNNTGLSNAVVKIQSSGIAVSSLRFAGNVILFSLREVAPVQVSANWGLPDFYQSWDFPDANYSFPLSKYSSSGSTANASYSGVAQNMVMNAGSSMRVTEYDYWLLRKVWYEIKGNLGY